jgi:hypothetical protein
MSWERCGMKWSWPVLDAVRRSPEEAKQVHEKPRSSQSVSLLRFEPLISRIQVTSYAAGAKSWISLLQCDETFRLKCSSDVGSTVRPNSEDVCSDAIVSMRRIYGLVCRIRGNVEYKLGFIIRQVSISRNRNGRLTLCNAVLYGISTKFE